MMKGIGKIKNKIWRIRAIPNVKAQNPKLR
jgi:hypothetical protein